MQNALGPLSEVPQCNQRFEHCLFLPLQLFPWRQPFFCPRALRRAWMLSGPIPNTKDETSVALRFL